MSYVASEKRYELMKYQSCGYSGLKLPKISLGLWHNFGVGQEISTIRDLLCQAFDAGITHFDAANNYGPPHGAAEQRLGMVLSGELQSYRDELIISTKAGYDMWEGPYGKGGSKKHLVASLNQSLRRLKLDYVDLFYSHCPDPHTPIEETVEALQDIKKQGKALYIGLSNYSLEQVEAIYALDPHLITVYQGSFSMLNREAELDLLPFFRKKKIGYIAYAPLAQGMLSSKYLNGIPEQSRINDPDGFLKKTDLTAERLKKIVDLKNLADKKGQKLTETALSWVLQIPGMTSAIIGVRNAQQLRENIQSLNSQSWTDEELIEVDQITGVMKGEVFSAR